MASAPTAAKAVQFRQYSPEPNPYALNRYDFEAGIGLGTVDCQRPGQRRGLGPVPNVKRLLNEINQRPAAPCWTGWLALHLSYSSQASDGVESVLENNTDKALTVFFSSGRLPEKWPTRLAQCECW